MASKFKQSLRTVADKIQGKPKQNEEIKVNISSQIQLAKIKERPLEYEDGSVLREHGQTTVLALKYTPKNTDELPTNGSKGHMDSGTTKTNHAEHTGRLPRKPEGPSPETKASEPTQIKNHTDPHKDVSEKAGNVNIRETKRKSTDVNANVVDSRAHQIEPIYASVSAELRDRISKNPLHCSVPFFIHTSVSLPQNSRETYVDLPVNLTSMKDDGHWYKIRDHLLKTKQFCIASTSPNFPKLLSDTIQGYRRDGGQKSNYKMLDRSDVSNILTTTIPIIVDQALELPRLLERHIPLLAKGQSKTIYLTRRLCCSLLANAFFCTFPESTFDGMPDFNFFRLFKDTESERCEVKKEKIKCLLNYFQQMSLSKDKESFQNQIVSFERRCVTKQVDWIGESHKLCEVKTELKEKIEQAHAMLQVDFANKMVGGGVLNDGSVMEEIRFCISPELIVSRLFTQVLNDDEVLVITGTEIFSEYTGFSTSFAFKGTANVKGDQKTDGLGRTFTQVVAMDASSFKRSETAIQFKKHFIDRELHKANVAFMHGKARVSPVATGNWGCGAFNGNPELKFLIQWLAASQQERPSIVYHTVGDQRQAEAINDISTAVKEKGMTVGELYKIMLKFSGEPGYQNKSLFDYVKTCVTGGLKKEYR